ncbi:chorismate--pyruvate lyase family protein [Oceanobacter mangrovi]|uniref:chorismate--pyruvate lyase family protein n=1 Tax=Oceanobacter mangrovi TaxID=2862510 RepID=UPI001C8D8DC9|nr:chorismate lyase [Oceanobacter mangrovi]
MKHRHSAKFLPILDCGPDWRSHRIAIPCRLPRQWRHWLCDNGSLTRRLQQHSTAPFRVDVLAEDHGHASPQECQDLGLSWPQSVWRREVALWLGNQLMVRARTVVPHQQLTQLNYPLRGLGNRSLGSFLFRQPNLQRQSLAIAPSTPALRQEFPWTRRSVFALGAVQILVSEAFSIHLLAPVTPASALE